MGEERAAVTGGQRKYFMMILNGRLPRKKLSRESALINRVNGAGAERAWPHVDGCGVPPSPCSCFIRFRFSLALFLLRCAGKRQGCSGLKKASQRRGGLAIRQKRQERGDFMPQAARDKSIFSTSPPHLNPLPPPARPLRGAARGERKKGGRRKCESRVREGMKLWFPTPRSCLTRIG